MDCSVAECLSASQGSVSEQNGQAEGGGGGAGGGEDGYSFSTEMISFSLYGKIPPKCKRPWNESFSVKIAEVQESFKNIPPMLYFSPSSVSYNGVGVYATDQLPKATILGPYFGKAVHKDEVEGHNHNKWLWEVYQDTSLAYFIDASDPRYGNWMNFIQCARSKQEQNLKTLQCNGCLYFEATRDIAVGEELLVWYDESQYDVYMGIPTGYRGDGAENEQPTGMTNTCFAIEHNTYNPSRHGEDTSLARATNSMATTTASCLSDASTCSTSTDDSGISMNVEHNGRPPPLTSSSSLNPEFTPPPPPLQTLYGGMTTTTAGDNGQPEIYPENNAQHRYPEPKSLTPSSSHSYQLPPLQTTHSACASGFQEGSQWPQTNGHPMSHDVPTDSTEWPLKAISKARSSTLLYGMFIRTPDGTRWKCEECQRLFSSQGSLRAHARIHTGERPYQCQYCFRTFCQASTLRSHERLHTGEKPYKCEHCGRAFTQSAGLRSHLKTHRYDS